LVSVKYIVDAQEKY